MGAGEDEGMEVDQRILAEFVSETGDSVGAPFDIPVDITVDKLQSLCNAFLQKEEPTPYKFLVNEQEITSSLKASLKGQTLDTEKSLKIIYLPQAVFKVRAVTRCTSSLSGHSEAVVAASFSPDGFHLATGSGDTTVRLWDLNTETPRFVCKGHRHWVLSVSWSPDGKKLASGCKNSEVLVWDPVTGKQVGKALRGHKQWITYLSWEPLHQNAECKYLASASKDGDIRIWDTVTGVTQKILTGHQQSVTCIKWGGAGFLYSASQDRTIKIWKPHEGVMHETLQGHAHWVNILALSTDYVLRTGAFEPAEAQDLREYKLLTAEGRQQKALSRYNTLLNGGEERMISGSDDFTLILWKPGSSKKPLNRMTGHKAIINDVKFSPDSRIIASASFDKSIKLWDGNTGRNMGTLRGHILAVYQIAWSADSRLLVSGSSDSTLKLWNIGTCKLEVDLPGHADEVYAVDWSTDGQRVVTGSKDKLVRIWRK